MKKIKNQGIEYGNEFLLMNDIRISVTKALAGIFIRICNICKIAITLAPIILILYLVSYIFFKESVTELVETIKDAFLL